MFEIVFLGTSASAPSVQRNVTANMVLYREFRFLIDCGEGTQRQLLKSGLGFRKLNRILITHGHLDHILGLAGLISTFSRWDVSHTIDIFAGPWALERIRDLILGVVLRGHGSNLWVNFNELRPGTIFENDTVAVRAFPVAHRGPDSYGFVFEEKPKRPFLADKAEALGIPFGPERGRLVRGETVTLSDGRSIEPDDVLGPPAAGTKLVYVGDVDNVEPLRDIVADADALVIEATYAEEDAELAAEHGHITARQAAELARDAGVGRLYLNHLSRRYHGPEVEAEAQRYFPNAVVANDFDRAKIR